jgi:hypothetical protein
VPDHNGLVDAQRIEDSHDIGRDGSNRNILLCVGRACGAVSVGCDAPVVLCKVGEDGEIVVLRRAEAVCEHQGVPACGCAGWMTVCVVELVLVDCYEGHIAGMSQRRLRI